MDAVKEVLQTALIAPEELGVISARLSRVDEQIAKIRRKRDSLFGIEKESRILLKEQIDKLEHERAKIQAQLQSTKIPQKHADYRLMSLEPLGWRDKDGLPRLALFQLANPKFEISFLDNPSSYKELFENLSGVAYFTIIVHLIAVLISFGSGSFMIWVAVSLVDFFPTLFTIFSVIWYIGYRISFHNSVNMKLPPILNTYFKDVRKVLAKTAFDQRLRSVSICASFTGVIPNETREKIHKAQKHFKKIFIMAEPNWEFQKVPIGDPLVVGWDGKNLWLVDSFDTTPVENYAKSEFVS